MTEYVSALLLGGILGMIGQGLRVIVGLKKLYDALEIVDGRPSKFDSRRLWLSLLIGFVAGAFGMILKIDYSAVSTMVMNKEFMISIVAIGYMGVDFIEGVMKTYLSKFERSLESPQPAPGPQYKPAPQNQVPVANNDNTNTASVDNSMGASPTDDLPVMDQPLNSNTAFNIPKEIPKNM